MNKINITSANGVDNNREGLKKLKPFSRHDLNNIKIDIDYSGENLVSVNEQSSTNDNDNIKIQRANPEICALVMQLEY